MKRTLSILFLSVGLFFQFSLAAKCNGYEGNAPGTILINGFFLEPGDTCIKYFGDVELMLILDTSATYVNCRISLSTVLLGVQTLLLDDPKYTFDYQLGPYSTKGKLQLKLGVSPQVSKVSGNFKYSVSANNESFTFKGDLIAWYVDG